MSIKLQRIIGHIAVEVYGFKSFESFESFNHCGPTTVDRNKIFFLAEVSKYKASRRSISSRLSLNKIRPRVIYSLNHNSYSFLQSNQTIQALLENYFKESRANVCNFRESVDSRAFLNFFIFCPNNLYSTLISKITLKLVTAFYFFRNRAKFEKR